MEYKIIDAKKWFGNEFCVEILINEVVYEFVSEEKGIRSTNDKFLKNPYPEKIVDLAQSREKEIRTEAIELANAKMTKYVVGVDGYGTCPHTANMTVITKDRFIFAADDEHAKKVAREEVGDGIAYIERPDGTRLKSSVRPEYDFRYSSYSGSDIF